MRPNLNENSATKIDRLNLSYQYLFDPNTQSQVLDINNNVQIYNQM